MALLRCNGVRGKCRIGTAPLYASATFKKDDFILWHATNEADVAAATGANIAAAGTNTNILGRALEDAVDSVTGVVKTRIKYIIWEPGTQFEMPIWHTSTGHASAIADPTGQLGTAYGIRHVAAVAGTNPDTWCCAIDDTTTEKCLIVDYNQDDLPTWPDSGAAGTNTNPRVWVEPMGEVGVYTRGLVA